MTGRKKGRIWMGVCHAADRFGIRSPVNELLHSCTALRYRAQFARNAMRLDRKIASSEVTAVVLTMEPSHFLEKCLAALKMQILSPADIVVIRNVSPFSKASQEGLDRVKTPYYVSVDDDMLLKPKCLEHMYGLMRGSPQCGEVVARLKDPILGSILGIHMYRTSAVRPIGFHPLVDEKGCERHMRHALDDRGHERIVYPIVEGDHRPEYLPHEAFWKFRFAAEKTRYYPGEKPTFREMADQISKYWDRTHDDVALYAWAGLFDGLQSEDISNQLTYDGRMEHPAFLRAQAVLSAKIPTDETGKG